MTSNHLSWGNHTRSRGVGARARVRVGAGAGVRAGVRARVGSRGSLRIASIRGTTGDGSSASEELGVDALELALAVLGGIRCSAGSLWALGDTVGGRVGHALIGAWDTDTLSNAAIVVVVA